MKPTLFYKIISSFSTFATLIATYLQLRNTTRTHCARQNCSSCRRSREIQTFRNLETVHCSNTCTRPPNRKSHQDCALANRYKLKFVVQEIYLNNLNYFSSDSSHKIDRRKSIRNCLGKRHRRRFSSRAQIFRWRLCTPALERNAAPLKIKIN